jgi:hypothetical protein
MRAAMARMSLEQIERATAAAADLAAALEQELASAPERYGPATLCPHPRS